MPTTKNTTPLYRQVLADAWRLSWTHKHLWVFGFFAAFIGYGGASDIILGAYHRLTQYLPLSAAIRETPWLLLPGFATLRAIVQLSPFPAVSLIFFVILSALLFGVIAWIISVAIAALISGVRKIERGGTPKIADGLKISNPTVARVFCLTVGNKFIISLAFLLTGLNLFNLLVDRSIIDACFFLLSFLLFTVIAVITTLISIYATNAAVMENLPFVPALFGGLKVLRKHWLISIETIAILLIINIVLGAVVLILSMILSVPLIFFFFLAAIIKSTVLMATMITTTIVVLIATVAVAGSFLATFQATVWSLLWIKLSGREVFRPKILRLADWFQTKITG